MGGKAIKKVICNRLSKEKYLTISSQILQLLQNTSIQAILPRIIPEKDSFGDIDILIDSQTNNLRNWIIEHYQPIEIVHNPNSFSFTYWDQEIVDKRTYYQIDFILVENIYSAQFFFSYGDIGVIIGKFMGYHGITFSDKGLLIKVRADLLNYPNLALSYLSNDQTFVYEQILLTSNVIDSCKFMGLNYEEWLSFTSIHDIYKWLISSHYYTIDAFQFVKMEKRKKLGDRPLYRNFLTYIGITDYANENNYRHNTQLIANQHNLLLQYNKMDLLEKIRRNCQLQFERKQKFHAQLFIRYGIKQLDLTKTISIFKKTIKQSNNNFDDWIDNHTNDEIDQIIHDFCQQSH